MRRATVFLLLAFLLLLSFPALAQEGGTVLVAMDAPQSLDPVQISRFDEAARDLAENLFIGLTRLNPRTGEVEPALAERWTVSEDNLTWTFYLRDDVQWLRYNADSGEVEALRSVVAGDVVFAIQRGCDPRRPSPLSDNLFIVAGCRAYANANTNEPIDINRTIAARAIDDHTLEIRLLFPASFFLTMTSLPEFRPLPAELVDDVNGNWLRPDSIMTSGAWVLQSWESGQRMQLLRNPLWPLEVEGNLEAVEVRFDYAMEALPAAISDGSVDIARVQAAAVSQLPGELMRSSDGQSLLLLGFSFNMVDAEGASLPGPLDNPNLRRALALGLDRAALAQTVFGAEASAATHFTPRSVVGAPSAPGAGFDPSAAQQALTAAGYPNCSGLGVHRIAVNQDAAMLRLAEAIVAQWEANLGCAPGGFPIDVLSRQKVLDNAHNMIDLLEEARYPLWLISWSADYPDAQSWVGDALHCDYGFLRVGRSCTQADALLDFAGLATDIRSRFTSYNQVETELFGGAGSFPVVPLVREQAWWVQQPWLTGVSSYGPFQFDRWTLNEN